MILTSTGPSAEWRGHSLGVFDYLQHFNKCPAYRQRHSVSKDIPRYLYRDDNGVWHIGTRLGSLTTFLLSSDYWNDSVPTTNWMFSEKGSWSSDPELAVSTSLPSVCPVMKISLHGEAARAWPKAGGEYRPTGEWSAGHPIFSNGDMYLCVVYASAWTVRQTPYGAGPPVLQSGSVTWDPTSPRAAQNQMLNVSSWQYWNEGWKDGGIRVTERAGMYRVLLDLSRV